MHSHAHPQYHANKETHTHKQTKKHTYKQLQKDTRAHTQITNHKNHINTVYTNKYTRVTSLLLAKA
jgi:hypothetical protein